MYISIVKYIIYYMIFQGVIWPLGRNVTNWIHKEHRPGNVGLCS